MTMDSTPAPRPGLGAKLFRFVMTVLFAAIAGPLVGALLVFIPLTVMYVAREGSGAQDIGLVFVATIATAYFVGGVIAVIAGVLVASSALWRPPTLLVVAVASALAALVHYVAVQPDAFRLANSSLLFVPLALSIAAATICWLIGRRFLEDA